MKIRNIMILTAAAVLLTGCGKKSSSSEKTLSVEGNWTLCDSDGFTSNMTSMEFKDSSEMSMTLTSDDYSLNYTGTYKLDGEKINIEFDKIENIEDLKKTTTIYDKYGLSDEELAETLNFVNENLTSESGEYYISNETEKHITKTGEERKQRINAYALVADDLQRAAAISDITVKGNRNGTYCIVCSDKSQIRSKSGVGNKQDAHGNCRPGCYP